MRRIFFIILCASVLILIGCSHSYSESEGYAHKHNAGPHNKTAYSAKDVQLSGKIENGIRVIKMRAFKYGFEPHPIVVKKNEKVGLQITSSDVTHGAAIEGYNINIIAPAGKTESVEFIADKTGKFHIHCSVYCGPGHGRMSGTLIVVEE